MCLVDRWRLRQSGAAVAGFSQKGLRVGLMTRTASSSPPSVSQTRPTSLFPKNAMQVGALEAIQNGPRVRLGQAHFG